MSMNWVSKVPHNAMLRKLSVSRYWGIASVPWAFVVHHPCLPQRHTTTQLVPRRKETWETEMITSTPTQTQTEITPKDTFFFNGWVGGLLELTIKNSYLVTWVSWWIRRFIHWSLLSWHTALAQLMTEYKNCGKTMNKKNLTNTVTLQSTQTRI